MNRPSQVSSALPAVLLVLLLAPMSPRAHSASDTVLITAVYYDTYVTTDDTTVEILVGHIAPVFTHALTVSDASP